MPDKRHEVEADRLLEQIGALDHAAAPQTKRLLAEALEKAERRGREMSASMKESSG